MSHRNDTAERWALELVNQIINKSVDDRDALPGSFVSQIKVAKRILVKHQGPRMNHKDHKVPKAERE